MNGSQKRRGQAQQFHLKKAHGDGRWVLTYSPSADVTLSLRIAVGGPWDWHEFQAEVRCGDVEPSLLTTFEIAPIEILPERLPWCEDVAPWNPSDEPQFLKIPEEYQDSFALMVRTWANVVGAVIPAL